jgi:hypothetical protein
MTGDEYKGVVKFPNLPEYVFIVGPGILYVFPEPQCERHRKSQNETTE